MLCHGGTMIATADVRALTDGDVITLRDAPGLEPMPKASGVKFIIKAITNSTYGHHGEMAFPEVTVVPWKANSSAFAKPKQ